MRWLGQIAHGMIRGKRIGLVRDTIEPAPNRGAPSRPKKETAQHQLDIYIIASDRRVFQPLKVGGPFGVAREPATPDACSSIFNLTQASFLFQLLDRLIVRSARLFSPHATSHSRPSQDARRT